MRKGKVRLAVYCVLFLAGLFVVLGGPAGIYLRRVNERMVQENMASPLEPVINRPMAVRFDPSYYYHGQRPKELAEELSERWSDAGVNLVFFRAYDPRFGAFYKTDYSYLPMGEYGQFDLLKAVLKACHDRQIEVFAWFPLLNLKEAWEKNPAWRAKTRNGDDHSETGLEFPLCARHPEARQWWQGLLEDFLGRYPRIDGVDLGEPVISWRRDAACFCERCRDALALAEDESGRDIARAEALTGVLRESVALIHKLRKPACITTIQTADASGKLLDPVQLRKITGFDLRAVTNGPAESTPDILCPEFIWQEHKSRYPTTNAFSPDWTEQAVRKFLGWIDTPAQIIAHVEITDFENAPVGKMELRTAIRAALRGGAEGIDVYSSNQLDEKNGWSVLRSFQNATPVKRCLVLYDENGGLNDAVQTGELLRHFHVDVSLRTVQTYTAGIIDQFDNVFYVGADESEGPLPADFLEDIKDTRARICWLGFNIGQLLGDPGISSRLGLEFVEVREGQFNSVLYKDTVLPKEDPWTNIVRITNEDRCRTMAMACSETEQAPFAVRSGRRFWFFADVPSAFAIEGGRALVFADLLHEILNEDHKPQQLAMVRIEDVHPLTDPSALNRIARLFDKANDPFQVATVPIFAYHEKNA